MQFLKNTMLLLLLVLVSACSQRFSKSKALPLEYSELKNMWVEKQEYFLGDTIRIFFKENHPGELGVKTPTDDFFYLVYAPTLSTIPGAKSILPHHHFKKVNLIELIPTSTKANPHDVRFTGNQILFTKSGIYTLLLSENLSTDAHGPAETLTIHYRHEKRRPGA